MTIYFVQKSRIEYVVGIAVSSAKMRILLLFVCRFVKFRMIESCSMRAIYDREMCYVRLFSVMGMEGRFLSGYLYVQIRPFAPFIRFTRVLKMC